jgi:hypothetical protein
MNLFTGGPIDGQTRDLPEDVMMRHVPKLNKSGRMMIAVYHRQDNGNFKFSYYMGYGKEWRDD